VTKSGTLLAEVVDGENFQWDTGSVPGKQGSREKQWRRADECDCWNTGNNL